MQQLPAPLPSVCSPVEIQGLRNTRALLYCFTLHGSANWESQFKEAAKGKEEHWAVDVRSELLCY